MSELGNLFNKYGCDKTKKHKYEKIYEPVFKKLKDKTDLRILEIGVFHGHSTEALLDYFPHAHMYGIDIFERTNPEDIEAYMDHDDRTHWLKASSTDPNLYKMLREKFGKSTKFDIIIDDGMHTPKANKETFENLHRTLKRDGVYFIEDVWPLELMNDEEMEHQWIKRFPDRYNLMDNQLFLNSLERSGLRVLRHDHRKLAGHADSYVIELRS